jgi:hypothetical protein
VVFFVVVHPLLFLFSTFGQLKKDPEKIIEIVNITQVG